jgi:hypothetical protein
MLKIKEGVDLKELERFGFRNAIGNTWCIDVANDCYDYFSTKIIVNPIGTFQEGEIIFNICDIDDGDEIDGVDVGARLDIVFDLIQAGLVEKNGEE